MDPQTSSTTSMPKQTDRGNLAKVIGVVFFGVVLLAGLVYTNVMLMQTKSKVDDLNKSVAKVNALSGQLNRVINTGATDKILGFDKVDKNAFQSVFLTNGQVYFGKITEITTSSVVLEHVYYLKDDNSNKSLVKLGCELHKPQDKMTIVRSNLQFWENLKADDAAGVTSAIKQYETANPNGQKCS